jgi:FlaA1/EpsC-like NDP-sugar epimerase
MQDEGMNSNKLSCIATGRKESLFKPDIEHNNLELHDRIDGKEFLIIGGAGSIGASTIKVLLQYSPKKIHVIDINENNLAELVRDLRGSLLLTNRFDFRALPLDYGCEIFHRFLIDQGSYDFVFNFAAIKHVRSEKDIYSILQMIDTNVIKQARLLKWLQISNNKELRYFSVSTDKAANPVNLMGATKRIMEHVIFRGAQKRYGISATSARFANVAFSDGSLLHGWIKRMGKKQPIQVPAETRRYFISLEESGHICLLAGVLGKNGHILVPKLSIVELKELVPIAREFIISRGFKVREYTDEGCAINNIDNDKLEGFYPLLLTPLDTSGEKPFEEFVGEGECAMEIGMEQLLAINHVPPKNGSVEEFISTTEQFISLVGHGVSKSEVVKAMARVISQLKHAETGKCLDDRF